METMRDKGQRPRPSQIYTYIPDLVRRADRSRVCFCALVCALFGWALLLNVLTPYVADDYSYMYSFATRERIEHVGQIVPSMIAHAHTMNGRLLAHSLEQLFLMFPKIVFDAVNAAVFTAYLLLICHLCDPAGRRRVSLLLAVFAAVWYQTLSFGQVFLWQDGSINYLWGTAAELVFLIPFVTWSLYRRAVFRHLWQWALFAVFSYFLGVYSETISFSAIFTGAAFTVAAWLEDRMCGGDAGVPPRTSRRERSAQVASLTVAALGYLTLFAAPASTRHAAGGIGQMIGNFARVSSRLSEGTMPLIAAWCLLALCALRSRMDRRRIAASGVSFVSALASAYVLTFASGVAPRCLCASSTLLILACGILLPDVSAVLRGTTAEGRSPAASDIAGLAFAAILSFFFLSSLLRGAYDILTYHRQYEAREAQILEAVEAGETDLVVDVLVPLSLYCSGYGLDDLSRDPGEWPNTSVARYYGISSITGRLSK